MKKIDIRPRQDDLYDIYVHDGNNDEPLLHSSQGYDGPGHPDELARRLFARPADQWNDDDPTVLRITYRDGTSKTERIA